MASVNKVILVGNLGKDPEVKRTPSGTNVATFSIATTERWKDQTGVSQSKAEWHNIVAWSKLGELAGQYLKKGSSVYIEGRIETRSWDGKDGQKKYKTEIVATQIQFLGGKTVDGVHNDKPVDNRNYEAEGQQGNANIDNDLPF